MEDFRVNKAALDFIRQNSTNAEYKIFLEKLSLYFDYKALGEKDKTRASEFCKKSLYLSKKAKEVP